MLGAVFGTRGGVAADATDLFGVADTTAGLVGALWAAEEWLVDSCTLGAPDVGTAAATCAGTGFAGAGFVDAGACGGAMSAG